MSKGLFYNQYVVHFMQFFRLAPPVQFNWQFTGGALYFNFDCGKAGLAITTLTVPTECEEQFHEVKHKDTTMFVYSSGCIILHNYLYQNYTHNHHQSIVLQNQESFQNCQKYATSA